jgi:plasmid maintenance system antidote protein VapI
MSPQFWLGLQMDYDLDIENNKLRAYLERDVRSYTIQADDVEKRHTFAIT